MSSIIRSSVVQQAKDTLSEVLRLILAEKDSPKTVLTEDDWNGWLEEEERITQELNEITKSQPNSGYLSLTRIMGSPKERKALQDAQALLTRIEATIDQRLRERIRQKPVPVTGGTAREGVTFSSQNIPTPEPDAGVQIMDADSNKPRTITTSPLNGQPGPGDVNVPVANTPLSDGSDCASAMADAVNTPLEATDGGKSDDSSSTQESPGDRNSATTSGTKQPTQPPAHSNAPSPSPQDNKSTSSTPRTGSQARGPPPPPRPSYRQRGTRFGAYVQATNCVDINGGVAEGITLNYGGKENTGAIIHKTVQPGSHLQSQSQGGAYVRTSFLDINGGVAEGMTLNYEGEGNSGAIIHKTVQPRSHLQSQAGAYVQATNCVDINGGVAEGMTLNYEGMGNTGAVILETE